MSNGETLTVVQSSASLSDPHICSDFRDRRAILLALFESLVARDPSGAYIPALAQRWDVAADARTWLFQLRAGVTFHNGDALHAADVVASLERVCDPALGGELGTQGVYLSYLAGASFRALDDRTVQIVTAEPLADLLDLLVDLPIAPRRALGDLPGRPIGSGPYRLVEAAPGRVVMEAFAQHHAGTPQHRRLVWLGEGSARRRAELLLTGAADLASGLAPEDVAAVEAAGITCVRALSGLCVIVMLNAASGPCADVRVRQALNYATDLPALIAHVLPGEAEPLSGPLTRLHLAHNPETPMYPHDPDRAAELLAEAGHRYGLRITLDIPTTLPDEALPLAELLAAQWVEAGIETTVAVHSDRPAYAEMVRTKRIGDACLFDSSPLSSVRVLREKIHSGLAGPWWQGYQSPQVDALIDRASATVDLTARQALYRSAYQQIHDDAPWVFLYSPMLRFGVGPRVRGWRPGLDGLIKLG